MDLIAVVDDDESLRRSVANFLRSAGLAVETFTSAEDFLGSVERARTRCMVLDLQMSGTSGLDLLRRLAAVGQRVPTVVLTAHGNAEMRRRCLAAGAVAFLDKPFHADALLDAIHAALR